MAPPATRSPELAEYFRFAQWLASKPNYRPVTKALLLYEVVEFFKLKECAGVGMYETDRFSDREFTFPPKPFADQFIIVSHDRTRCFIVDEEGHVSYREYNEATRAPQMILESWI